MSRILPLLAHDENRHVLTEWLEANTDHESITPDPDAPLSRQFDLCIVDGTSLREHAAEIQSAKAAAHPVFLPVLLLISRKDALRMSDRVWDSADGIVFQQLDESIPTPIAKFELTGRVRALLSMRETTRSLATSSERFRSLTEGVLDTSRVATFVVDDDVTVAWLNRAAVEYFGIDRKAAIGLDKRQLVVDEICERVERPERFADAIVGTYEDNTYVEEFECHVLPGPNREERWLTHWSQPIATGLYEGGRVEHYYDVTLRKEREQALRRYKAVLSNSNDISVLVNDEGAFDLVNPRLASLTGLSADEIEGRDPSVFVEAEIISPATAERLNASIRRILTGEQSEEKIEFPVEVGGTHSRIIELRLTSLVENGAVDGVVGIGRDVTERQRRERDLRRLEKAIDQAASAIYFTDSSGRIEYSNPRFEELTGYAQADVVGKTPRVLKSDEQPDGYYERLWDELTAGELHTDQIINRRKSGERYVALQTIAPITDEAGTIEGYVAVQNDITDQQRNQQRLQVLQRVLRHNLRNDLNVILGHAELIATASDDDEIADSVQQIDETVHALSRLSEKVQSVENWLVSIESEDPRPTVELSEALRRTQTDTEKAYPDVSLAVEYPDRTVPVDIACRAILSELVENAIRHNDTSTPEVTIGASVSGDDCEIRVVDDGPGIPSIEREALETETETPLRHGSSVGLWMVKWIVETIGGTIAITDREPRESILTVSVPVASTP